MVWYGTTYIIFLTLSTVLYWLTLLAILTIAIFIIGRALLRRVRFRHCALLRRQDPGADARRPAV